MIKFLQHTVNTHTNEAQAGSKALNTARVHGDRLKELIRVECASYVGALPVECDRFADDAKRVSDQGGQEGAKRFTLLRVRVPAATAPDERGLHADFLGYQLQKNPFSVVHFRPQLFPAENKTSIKQYAPQQHKSTQQPAQRSHEQILGERVNHFEEAMPQPPWKTRERGASHLRHRVLARLRLCRRCQCCGLLRKRLAGIHSGRSISSRRLIPSSRKPAQPQPQVSGDSPNKAASAWRRQHINKNQLTANTHEQPSTRKTALIDGRGFHSAAARTCISSVGTLMAAQCHGSTHS